MSLVSERASSAMVEDLPNLKIEIENDLNQKMETDDDDDDSSVNKVQTVSSSETEEGELIDDDDRLGQLAQKKSNIATAFSSQTIPTGRSILKYDTKEYVELQHQSSVKNPNGAFVTGVNVFSPEEQAKLDKRAQRFGIEASDAKVLTEKLLKKLYKSMGVKPSDKNIRVDALHMRGTEQMTTEDVFDYFRDYGPASLEWISDNSCNVVWLDDISAARALLGLSVHISGQEPMNPSQSDVDSDVDMESQNVPDNSDCLSEESDAVAIDDLGVELPSGQWRRGAPHSLSPCVLLRFATTSDRSLPRPGFTKFGSHEFGSYVGLISESRKRRLQGALPRPIIFEDVGDEIIPKPGIEETDHANPWGVLAKTWSQFDKVRKPRPPSPVIERVIPMPSRMTPPPSPPEFLTRPRLTARTRRRRERDAKVVARTVEDLDNDSSDTEEWQSRSKMPRMRMHADDEEKKLEKRLKKSHRKRSSSFSPTRNDLRRRIAGHKNGGESEKSPEPEPVVEEPEEDDEVPDLRVAVAADRDPSPEDSKTGIRQTLFSSGNVKSVLKGARGNDEDDDEDEEESENSSEHVKSPVRRHRSRSKERRKHHRKHRKESSKRRDSDSESDERAKKAVRSTIKRKSPERRENHNFDVREKRSPHESRDKKSSRHERRRRHKDRESEVYRKDSFRHRYSEDDRSGKDLRSKLAQKQQTYDSNNQFRSKSPLQIEIDNDEYIEQDESD